MINKVLRATLDVPFECSFKKAGEMNALRTYKVPPIPTIQGMIYSSIARPSLLLQTSNRTMEKETRDKEEKFRKEVRGKCNFGIRIIQKGPEYTGLKNRHKVGRSNDDEQYITYVVNEETLIEPTYRIYVGGPENFLTKFEKGLKNPKRPLYLGRSDDIVDIHDVNISEIEHVKETISLDCVVPGSREEPSMLPVEPDKREGVSTKPAKVKTVSIEGGEVDSYYETSDGEKFVFIT